MTIYKTSDLAATLAGYIVYVNDLLAHSHPTMHEYALAQATAHNDALELLGGFGKFAEAWTPKETDEAGNPIVAATDAGDFAVPLDSLSDAVKLDWHRSMDAELARDRVMQILLKDPNHPVAKNWRVIQARCYQPGQLQPWPEIEAALAAMTPVEG